MAEHTPILITISRQLGAGGVDLGQRLATKLGYAYLDRELLRLAALELGVPQQDLECWEERATRFWERMAHAMGMGPPEGVFSTSAVTPVAMDRRVFEVEARIMRDISRRENAVIIGRGSTWVLRGHPGLIRVFLHAPPTARAQTVKELFGLRDEIEARKLIQKVDAERERFAREMVGVDSWDARQHDLCINTSRVCMDLAERMVLDLVASVQERLQVANP
jgi:cytidylate kinase